MKLLGAMMALMLLLLPPGAGPSSARAAASASDTIWTTYRQAKNYEKGRGVPRSWRRARALYERVLASDNREAAGFAALALGTHYLQPGSSNPARAAEYFRKGDDLGERWSTLKLGELFEKGQGVKPSPRRSRAFYLRAAQAPDAQVRKYAHAALGRLYTRRPLRDMAQAIAHFEEAIRLGDDWSAFFLAEIHLRQKRTLGNRAEIERLLAILRDSGDQKAREAADTLSRKLPKG